MTGVLKHPFRVSSRLVWLLSELASAALHYVVAVPCGSNSRSLKTRARWLQASCRRVLRIFNADIQVTGPIPNSGLLVSNHLSYFDILVLSGLTPAVFVAKREVRNWPVFGWFARMSGTLFADRTRKITSGALAAELRTTLNEGALVVLFPEGTSSDGSNVLPFKSALLDAATNPSRALSASHITYRIDDGDVAEEVCYWKDMTLLPHLLNLLGKERIRVSVRFSELRQRSAERKELARELRSEVLKLKGSCEVPGTR